MSLDTWFFYVATVLVLMSTPGPSHLLMLSISASNGFPRSLATAAGDLSANTLQILAAGFGLAAAVGTSLGVFTAIKWAGVAYLVWLGLRQILASFAAHGSAGQAPRERLRALWLRGFITSAANPKAIIFFAALFPQFIDAQKPLFTQIALLGATYIVIDAVFLSAYGSAAAWIAKKLNGSARPWLERMAGAGLILAALLLSMKTLQVGI